MKIDVIVPIYNAYEYLVACVESLYKYTIVDDFNLILINDRSSDERINMYLNKIANTRDNLFIYQNDENLGFVGTVNKGMKLSQNDVVLLNSDTEVTPNWLQKMVEAANSSRHVATVTALTNSGTICSVPNFCEDNEIPKNLSSYIEMNEIIERSTTGLYPEVPTGVGFCMYIKRIVLNEVGYFNEEEFGKGYGEENDFCCRCIEHGFKNIIDDKTFIYHKGSMSFNESKNDYIKANLKTLENLYPYYFDSVTEFIKRNPLQPIHDLIKLNILLKNNKENILFVLHNDFIEGRNHPCGGTEIHVRDLVTQFKKEFNCFVLTTNMEYCMLDIFVDEEIKTMRFELSSSIKRIDYYRDDYYDIVGSILSYFHIALIHIHHLKGHTFDVFDLAEECHIPVIFTAHDYYCGCPNINLLYDDRIYCESFRNDQVCNECIKCKMGFSDIISTWRLHFYKYLCRCQMIIVPSEAAKREISNIFSQAGYNISLFEFNVIYHGEFHVHKKYGLLKQNEKFTICIFGGIIKHKGSEIIHDVISGCNLEIEWHILGNVYDDKVKALDLPNVHIHPPYEQKNIVELLRTYNPDITLSTPLWPETFSYVLTESFLADIPVLGTDMGALHERIIEGENGWKIKMPAKPEDISKKISDLYYDRSQVRTLKKRILLKSYKTIDEMMLDYQKLYSKLICQLDIQCLEKKIDKRIILDGFKKPKEIKVIVKEIIKEPVVDEDEYRSLLEHVQEINRSKLWRIFVKITFLFDKVKGLFRRR